MPSTYTPRSGTFRKVKYALDIYKEGDISPKDFKEVVDMAEKVKAAEAVDNDVQVESPSNYYYKNGQGSPCNVPMKKVKKDLNQSLEPSSRKNTSDSSDVLNEVRTPEFTVTPVDVYRSVYPDDDTLPPFPVTSYTDSSCFSDSDVTDYQSEYEMDSEDEEWISSNEHLHITPNRLEYIFTKLNKRNTHVPWKAIGALPESVHPDFNHIFPYWKRKRLQNKNYSSINSKTEVKQYRGYASTDPSVIFVRKIKKPPPQMPIPHLTLTQKLERREEATLRLNQLVKFRDDLINLRVLTSHAVQTSLNVRDQIRSKMTDFILKSKPENSTDGERKENSEVNTHDNAEKAKIKASTSTPVQRTSMVLRRLSHSNNKQASNVFREIDSKNVKLNVRSLSAPAAQLLKTVVQQAKVNKRKSDGQKVTGKAASLQRVFRSKRNKFVTIGRVEKKKNIRKVIVNTRQLRRRRSY